MNQPDPPLGLARGKIAALDAGRSAEVSEAATRLPADLHGGALNHGSSPDAWSYVASLGHVRPDVTSRRAWRQIANGQLAAELHRARGADRSGTRRRPRWAAATTAEAVETLNLTPARSRKHRLWSTWP